MEAPIAYAYRYGRAHRAPAQSNRDCSRAGADQAHHRLRSSRETLVNALTGHITNAQRLVLKMQLEEVEQMERHMDELEHALAQAQATCQDAMERLYEIPGISARAAQQIIAEIGAEPKLSTLRPNSLPWWAFHPDVKKALESQPAIGLPREIASCAVSYRSRLGLLSHERVAKPNDATGAGSSGWARKKQPGP